MFLLDLRGSNAYIFNAHAGIAQLVERNLAKVDVAGSSPVSRSVSNGSSPSGDAIQDMVGCKSRDSV